LLCRNNNGATQTTKNRGRGRYQHHADSFVKETGIDPRRPVAETTAAKPRGNILIGVDTNGFIWMNKQRIELNQVRQLVEDAVNENPESSAIIIADESSATGVVIEVMDQVRLGGVIEIAVAAEPEAT
jgi:biopolymer transport protein ExbD